MRFKTKDLMINDLSEQPTPTCGPRSQCGPRSLAPPGWAPVYACLISHDPFARFDPEVSPESLKALREQLKQQIEEIFQQEAKLEQKLQPQTVEEVDALSPKLRDALEELQALRAKLA
jgi:TRAP-type C4-dicarboxylate transport system substrate-binding protein